MSAKDAKFFVTRLYLFDVCLIRVIAYRSLKLLKSNRKNRSPLREGVLRVVLPPAIVLSATITWAGDVKNPANDLLLAMSPRHQADILGKIAGEACKGKTAFYQGTMKDLPQPKGDHRPQLPVPPEHEDDTFWNIMCKNGRSYSIEVHPDGSNKVVECGMVKMSHLGECFKKF
jgi:hypothetical protein